MKTLSKCQRQSSSNQKITSSGFTTPKSLDQTPLDETYLLENFLCGRHSTGYTGLLKPDPKFVMECNIGQWVSRRQEVKKCFHKLDKIGNISISGFTMWKQNKTKQTKKKKKKKIKKSATKCYFQ